MCELVLTSPLPPSVNHYLGYRAIVKDGRARTMSYRKQSATEYKEAFTATVREEAERQGWTLTPNKTQHFYVDTYFYFDKLCRDANNYYKLMLDAITDSGLIWFDDNVVCERVQRILYDAANPRVELRIRPVEYIGIFDNAAQLEEFTSRCFGCTRYANHCSVLRKAKEGRIQEEIDGLVCMCRKQKRTNERNRRNGKE